jgi:hypothetical protein
MDPVALKHATDRRPERASTDPDDRSRRPQMMRMVSPKARMVVTEICRVTLDRFVPEKKFGLMTELMTRSTIRTR